MKHDMDNLLLAQLGCFIALIVATIAYRFNLLAFKSFAMSTAVLLLLCLVLAVVIVLQLLQGLYQQGVPFLTLSSVVAGLLAAVLISVLGGLFYRIQSVPPIHDITTDTDNPPDFTKAYEYRQSSDNSLDYLKTNAHLQKAAYPDVRPLFTTIPSDQAFERALTVAKQQVWEIHHADKLSGTIEATATSRIFGFVDDVVIRVTADGGVSRIDLRSVSRVGVSDLGANAQRIKKFVVAFKAKE
jgi:uncharacterized protein (DUF1499 family)